MKRGTPPTITPTPITLMLKPTKDEVIDAYAAVAGKA
jgi:hypothetical protein